MTTKKLPWKSSDTVNQLLLALTQRILVMDGAMGTMLQSYQFDESGYRGARFATSQEHTHNAHCNHTSHETKTIAPDLKGNNDLLTLTQPDVVRAIHRAYLEAGADFVETNTFNATSIAQADYQLEHLAYELNYEGARLAHIECTAMSARTPEKPRWVIGVLGPTNRTASMSPDVNNPGFRNINFDQLVHAYRDAAAGLIDGGSDLIMIETIFDVLNAKAAIFAITEVFEERGYQLPLMISGTITDLSGRTLSGQTAEAFWYSVKHAQPFAIGFNCALGAAELRQYIDILSPLALETAVSVHPNAGLPNAFGGYDETPEHMAALIKEFAQSGLVNIVGGCCGTTPAHIQAMISVLQNIPPRRLALTQYNQVA